MKAVLARLLMKTSELHFLNPILQRFAVVAVAPAGNHRLVLDGLRELILEALNESGAAPSRVQMIDSSIIRAHHQAAGAKGRPKKEGFGRSKGGFTTDVRLIFNAGGLPMKAEITSGEVSEYKDNIEKPAELRGYRLIPSQSLTTTTAKITDAVVNVFRRQPVTCAEASFEPPSG